MGDQGGSKGLKIATSIADGRKGVFIVDDHPVLRQGLGALIDAQSDMRVCGEADSAPVAKTEVARCSPDVVIVDISLATGSGLELIKDLHYQHPGLPLLALSMHREELYGPRAIAAGAKGYVCKSEPVTHVLVALRRLLQGQLAVSEKVLGLLVDRNRRKVPDPDSAALPLSDRELEIFRLFGEGRSTREIAARLRIAVSTVFAHRANIKHKLKLANATELVSAAARFVAVDDRA